MDAFIINLVMSVLFVELFFERVDLKGLSIYAAWLKLAGTLFSGIALFRVHLDLVARGEPDLAFPSGPASLQLFYFLPVLHDGLDFFRRPWCS